MSEACTQAFKNYREIIRERQIQRLNDNIIGARIEEGMTIIVCRPAYAFGTAPQKSANNKLRTES